MARPQLTTTIQLPSRSIVSPISLGSPTPTEKKHLLWNSRPRLGRHKVSFSDSSLDTNKSNKSKARDRSKSSSRDGNDSSQSDNSRSDSPPPRPRRAQSHEDLAARQGAQGRHVQIVDKRAEAAARELTPPPTPEPPPFLAYTDAFFSVLGPNPSVNLILHDSRAPFFTAGGIFHKPTTTLFLTSSPLSDASPGAAPSHNLSIVTTSISFYHGVEITRDKVRFPSNYMPSSGCVWHPPAYSAPSTTAPQGSPGPSSLIFCAQGTLSEPAGLIQVAPKRPHTAVPVLTSYMGEHSFNSPHSAVALSDGSVLFSDPAIGYEIGFRPRPEMPALIYRFDPTTGDCRAIADGLVRPTALAVTPDERTLYVVDAPLPKSLPPKGARVGDVLDACMAPLPTIQAYTLHGGGGVSRQRSNASNGVPEPTRGGGANGLPKGVEIAPGFAPPSGLWMTDKRLFALPEREPTGLAVDAAGNVFAACAKAGVVVYARDGTFLGKVRVGEGKLVSGICFGRKGELFAWGGSNVWRVGLKGWP